MNNATSFYLAIVRQVNRTIELGILINLYSLFAPDVFADVLCWNLKFDNTLQRFSVCTHILAQVSNVTPIAISYISVNWIAFFKHVWEKFLAEVVLYILLKVRENLRIQDVDTCVNCIAKDLAPAWFLQELGDVSLFVRDNNTIFQWIRNMCEC